MRKFIVTNLIVVIMAFSFIASYTRTCNISYAAVDDWHQVTTNDQLVEAFKFYCKSRDLTIDGSVADAVTSFTTSAYQNICTKLGLNMNAIQADLKYHTDSNGGLQFLFNQSGLSTYNRIFAQFLQDNNLSVGDSVDDLTVKSGRWFTDQDGYSCYVFDVNYYYCANSAVGNVVNEFGTPYRLNPKNIPNLIGQSFTFHLTSTTTWNFTLNSRSYGSNPITVYPSTFTYEYPFYQEHDYRGYRYYYGYPIIAVYQNELYYGSYMQRLDPTKNSSSEIVNMKLERFSTDTNNLPTVNVYLTTFNGGTVNTITDEYTLNEGDTTIITNEGDTIINEGNENPDPVDPSDPDDPTPPTPPTPPSILGYELPDLSDLNSVNLFLDGLKDKFPFSIPWDMYLLLAVLNAPPEAPRFQGTVDFKIYEWEYDLDFSDFDEAAQILRALELMSFTMGLILLTRYIIKG